MSKTNEQVVAEATAVMAQGLFDGNRGQLIGGIRQLIEFLRGIDFDKINAVLREVLDAIENLLGEVPMTIASADLDAVIQEAVAGAALPGPTAQMNLSGVIEFVKIVMSFINLFRSISGSSVAKVIEAAGSTCCQDETKSAEECSSSDCDEAADEDSDK